MLQPQDVVAPTALLLAFLGGEVVPLSPLVVRGVLHDPTVRVTALSGALGHLRQAVDDLTASGRFPPRSKVVPMFVGRSRRLR